MTHFSVYDIADKSIFIAYLIIHYDANTESETVIKTYTNLQKKEALEDVRNCRKGNSGAADWYSLMSIVPIDEDEFYREIEQEESNANERIHRELSEQRRKKERMNLHKEMAAYFKAHSGNQLSDICFVEAYNEQERDCIKLTLTFEKIPSYSGHYVLENNCGDISLHFLFAEHNTITFLQKDDSYLGFTLPSYVYSAILMLLDQHSDSISEHIADYSLFDTKEYLKVLAEENKP